MSSILRSCSGLSLSEPSATPRLAFCESSSTPTEKGSSKVAQPKNMALAAFVLAGVMMLLAIFGVVHQRRTPETAEI